MGPFLCKPGFCPTGPSCLFPALVMGPPGGGDTSTDCPEPRCGDDSFVCAGEGDGVCFVLVCSLWQSQGRNIIIKLT